METNNNVQKTVLRIMIVLTVLLFVSFNTTAQDSGKLVVQNNVDNNLAHVKSNTSIETKSESTTIKALPNLNLFTSPLKTETEVALNLEEWMTNDNLFCVAQNLNKKEIISASNAEYHELKDPTLVFESWMFNLNYWTINR